MGMDGGGRLPYSYGAIGGGGGGGHHDGKLVKSFSRVEPRKFGLGLVAGFLPITCAYFSTAKFDAIHIAVISPTSKDAAGMGSLVTAGGGSEQQPDLGAQHPDALSKEGSKAEVLEKDDGKISSLGPDSGIGGRGRAGHASAGDGGTSGCRRCGRRRHKRAAWFGRRG